MHEAESTNHTEEEEEVRAKPEALINDVIPLNDDILSEGLEKNVSRVLMEEEQEAVRVKEEVDDGGGGVEGSPEKAVKWGYPPAPFLKEMFEMVEDPDTDPVVSLSESCDMTASSFRILTTGTTIFLASFASLTLISFTSSYPQLPFSLKKKNIIIIIIIIGLDIGLFSLYPETFV